MKDRAEQGWRRSDGGVNVGREEEKVALRQKRETPKIFSS